MKRILAVFLLLFFSSRVFPQYIFNSCNQQPAVGDSLIYTIENYDTAGISSGSSGANAIWNFSPALSSSQHIAHYYFNAPATPGFSVFSRANSADSCSDGYWYYYNYNSDSITYYGNFYDLTDYHASWDPQKQITCPLYFGNSFSDHYNWCASMMCPVNHIYMNRTITYDAFGILNFMKSSFAAARIKIFESGVDSILCAPYSEDYIKDTTYIWFDTLSRLPVLQLEYRYDSQTASEKKTFQAFVYSHVPALVATGENIIADEENISVYPNPSSGIFTIQVNSDKSTAIREIEIYNIYGEKVYSRESLVLSQSANYSGLMTMDLSSSSAGIYFMQLKTAQGTITKKIIIGK